METKYSQNPFPYDEANIFNDLFLTWAFPLVKYYRSHPPDLTNTIDLPKRFEYDACYKKVKAS